MRSSVSLICLLVAAVAIADEPKWQRVTKTQPHMGSTVTIVAYAKDVETGERAVKLGFARIVELNAIFSDYESDSECTQLSRAAPTKKPISVSDEMAALLSESLLISRESSGAFDVTVGPLSRLWRRARKKRQLPDEQRLKAATAATGYELVELDAAKKTVSLKAEQMRLDLGGIAKGYIADAALKAVREAGCPAALVNAGGDIAVGDAPPDRDGWRIGVAPLKPRDPPSQILNLSNCGIATSGDAWQFLEIDGKRFSHIIDPRTGAPVARRCSVTVLSKNCTNADGWASAISVLGPDAGVSVVENHAATHCLIVEDNDGTVVTYASKDFPSE